jgi:predicted aldo/keto reductase-like oxidoreductase
MSKKLMARREFLKTTTTGLGAFFFLSSNDPKSPGRTDISSKGERTYTYRTLGKTGIKLPVITMGVMNSDNPNLVRAALDAGLVMLDTAQVYQRGTNEGMIGEVLKGRLRDSYVIATKGLLPKDQNTGLYTAEATEEAFQKKIDQSLKNLGLDYVDIYYHHNVWRRESALYEPIMKALEKSKKAGKTRFVGITTHSKEPEVLQAAVDSNLYDVVLTAYNFRQHHYAEVRQAMAKAAGAGLGIVAMKTMGGNPRGNYSGETKIDAPAALKWALQDPNVHTIIAGFTTFDQLNLDLSVLEAPALTKPEKAHLRKAVATVGLYCQGCEQCLSQCSRKLPIPDLMRAYMYVYGYRNLVAAQDLIFSLALPLTVCGDCGDCPVKCANGFKVAERIRNVVRLREVPAEFIA